jgi:hypothetical protein
MMDHRKDHHIGQELLKGKLENVHCGIVDFSLAQYALQDGDPYEGYKKGRSGIDAPGVGEHVYDKAEEKAQHKDRGVIFADRVEEYEPDVEKGIDISKEVDVVQHDDLQQDQPDEKQCTVDVLPIHS